MLVSLILSIVMYQLAGQEASYYVGVVLLVVILTVAIIGRALFYVLVIPTTMPGAFFWQNKGFQEHARETGLASMPQVGVLPGGH